MCLIKYKTVNYTKKKYMIDILFLFDIPGFLVKFVANTRFFQSCLNSRFFLFFGNPG